MITEFFMAMVPPTITQQEHKVAVINGKPEFYDPPELKVARQRSCHGIFRSSNSQELWSW